MNFKNWKKYLTWLVLTLIVIVVLIWKFSKNDTVENTKGQVSRLISVNGIILKGKFLQNNFFSNGSLSSIEQVDLKCETAGRIVRILFTEGKFVKKGTLLVKLNDADLQATLKKNLSKEKLLKEKENRIKQLFDKDLSSKEEYENIQNELNNVLGDIELTQALIAKTEVKAPFDGIIGIRNVSEGAYINLETSIATLQNNSQLKLDFTIPQKYFSLVQSGKSVKIKSGENKIFTGKIFAIEPKIDELSRSLKVRAMVPNVKSELYPGAYVEIDLILEELNDAILVPTNAIVPELDGEKVFIYKNGKAVLTPVNIGIRREKDIQIKSGLNAGDTLIVSGIIQLKDKLPVKILVSDEKQKDEKQK